MISPQHDDDNKHDISTIIIITTLIKRCHETLYSDSIVTRHYLNRSRYTVLYSKYIEMIYFNYIGWVST
jgi:hypothetical protein